MDPLELHRHRYATLGYTVVSKDGIMASMSVDEIRVKVGQNLRFGAEC